MTLSEFFDSPTKWTQGASARDKDGNPVLWNSPEAICWCLIGAINVTIPQDHEARVRLYDKAAGLAWWQDRPGRTFEEFKAKLVELGL